MTTFIVHEGALGIDNDLSVPFCLEEEESVATAQEKKAQKTTQRISMAMLILGTLSLGYTVVKDYVGGRSSDKRLGNIETSLRVLTQTVAPQIYKSIDDSLRSALTQNGPDSAKSLAGAQANMKQLQALNVRLDAKQLMQSGSSRAWRGLGHVWSADFVSVSIFGDCPLARAGRLRHGKWDSAAASPPRSSGQHSGFAAELCQLHTRH
jgi:hypothetical protein